MRLCTACLPHAPCACDSVLQTEIPRERDVEFPLRASVCKFACKYFGFHAGVSFENFVTQADKDPVIQIANVVKVQGSDDVVAKNVFTLGGCTPIVGAHVISNATEDELLWEVGSCVFARSCAAVTTYGLVMPSSRLSRQHARHPALRGYTVNYGFSVIDQCCDFRLAWQWSQFVKVADPDILTGYNIQNFDVPYLLNRAKALSRKSKKLEKFGEWGRLRGKMATMK